MSNARRDDGIRQAVAARERGRAKVRSTTTAVTMASVVTAGALALALPGSAHKTSTSSGSGSSSAELWLRLHRTSSGSGSGSSSASSGSGSTGTSSGSSSSSTGSGCTGSGSSTPAPATPARVPAASAPAPHRPRSSGGGSQATSGGSISAGHRHAPRTPSASASWRALGTLVQLVVTEPAALPEARRLLDNDLAAVDAACSRFRADSEIRSLTAAASRISPLLAEAIAVALRAARLTDGDVDPTVGAAMSVVGYDRDFEKIEPNGPPLRLTVRKVPGWRQVRLDGRSLTLPAGVQLDLGATAKAWAADRSAARIASTARLRRAGQPGRRHRGGGPGARTAAGGSGCRT